MINALLTGEETRAQALALLQELTAQQQSRQGLTYWRTALTTFLGSSGESADQETTALIAYALLLGSNQIWRKVHSITYSASGQPMAPLSRRNSRC